MLYFKSVYLLVAFSFVILLAGCSSAPRQAEDPGKNYYTSPREALVTLTSGERGTGANDQPATLAPGRLEALLGSLYYLEDRGAIGRWFTESRRKTPLVPETKVSRVSLALAEALADAGAREDVVVGLREPVRDSSDSITHYKLTMFRAFVQNNRLNLLFGTVGENLDDSNYQFDTIHRKAQTQNVRESIRWESVLEKAGSRGVTADLGSGIYYSGPEATLQRLRDDWIALDLEPLASSSGASPAGSSPEKEKVKAETGPEEEEAKEETTDRQEKLLRKELIYL